MSNEEDDHLEKLSELEDHPLKNSLETNLNDLFQNEKELNVGKHLFETPLSVWAAKFHPI